MEEIERLPLSENKASPTMTQESKTALTSIAIRAHNIEAMRAFYTEAFGGLFNQVDLGGGLQCYFGQVLGITIKLVPLRDSADFESFPLHQLGFVVDDVQKVIEIAKKHGGREEGEVTNQNGQCLGAARDPDGNSIELMSFESEA